MRTLGVLSFLTTLGLVLAVWLGGVRVVVIQPIGALPDGVTAVVAGLPGARLIDSPDSMCLRSTGEVTLICRGVMAGGIAGETAILLRLPYSRFLYNLTVPDYLEQ